jgi:hypothetical protein
VAWEASDREVALRDAAVRQIERSDHNAKHVVEVVGDAARQLPDGLHLLRLPQLAFHLFPLRDLLLKIAVGGGQFIAGHGEMRKCPTRGGHAQKADRRAKKDSRRAKLRGYFRRRNLSEMQRTDEPQVPKKARR